MKHRIRHRALLLLLLLSVLCLIMLLVMRSRIAPIAEDLAVAMLSDRASDIIVAAVGEQLEEAQIDYDRLVYLEKDTSGNITALRTNMLEINQLKVLVLEAIGERIVRLSEEDLSIALGSLLAPEFFSGRGPKLPVRVIAVSSSDAEFESQLTAAGINQTLHQIVLHVSLSMTVLLPTGTTTLDTTTQVIVAETVLVGMVPDTYFELDGLDVISADTEE